MNLRDSADRYSVLSIRLHWLMVVLIAAVYGCIELRELFEKGSDPRETLKALHFMLGLTVLILVAVRIYARLTGPTPPIVPEPPKWQMLLAKAAHLALYLLMIGMPIAGWVLLSAAGKPIPFFGLELPALIAPDKGLADTLKELHKTVGEAGYYVIGLHAVAALFHHYISRDDTLRRMLPTRR